MTSHERESTGSAPLPEDAPASNSSGSTAVAELFAVHAVLRRLNQQKTQESQASSALVVQQRGELEATTEWLRRLESGLRDARNHVDTLGAALDRIKIVALNTGLEGARLGDVAGKALIAVSDELRNLTSRGLELLSEQASTVEQMETDRQRIAALAEHAQTLSAEVEQRLRGALASEQTAADAIARLARALELTTGLDVESAAQLSRISEQARELFSSLSSFALPDQRKAAHAALAPALEPLLTWLTSRP